MSPDQMEVLLTVAKHDLTAAKLIINNKPILSEIACFHSQQAVEKSLKAYLADAGIAYPKIHDLPVLCKLCKEQDDSFVVLEDDCDMLTQFATIARYETALEFSEADAYKAYNSAVRATEFIGNKVSSIAIKFTNNDSAD